MQVISGADCKSALAGGLDTGCEIYLHFTKLISNLLLAGIRGKVPVCFIGLKTPEVTWGFSFFFTVREMRLTVRVKNSIIYIRIFIRRV